MPPTLEIKQIDLQIYGLCVLREREPSPGSHYLDIFLVGADECVAAHNHDPAIFYDGAHKDPPVAPIQKESLLGRRLDLTALPTKTSRTLLPKNIVSLYDITQQYLPAQPNDVPNVAGYVTLLGGKRGKIDNPGPKEWGRMRKQDWKVEQRWGNIAWYVTWSIELEPPLPKKLDLSFDSLACGAATPTHTTVYAKDVSGVIRLHVSNLPVKKEPPAMPGPVPEDNTYVPHFPMFKALYPDWVGSWPHLVYAPQEGVEPTPMSDYRDRILTTAYTCVPSGGK